MDLVLADPQPFDTDINLDVDGMFAKHILVRKAGTVLPQHSHHYAHISLISAGAVSLYVNDTHIGDYEAPKGVVIEAGKKHLFVTLQDNTVITCLHNISRTGAVDIEEEHSLGV